MGEEMPAFRLRNAIPGFDSGKTLCRILGQQFQGGERRTVALGQALCEGQRGREQEQESTNIPGAAGDGVPATSPASGDSV